MFDKISYERHDKKMKAQACRYEKVIDKIRRDHARREAEHLNAMQEEIDKVRAEEVERYNQSRVEIASAHRSEIDSLNAIITEKTKILRFETERYEALCKENLEEKARLAAERVRIEKLFQQAKIDAEVIRAIRKGHQEHVMASMAQAEKSIEEGSKQLLQ